MWVDGHGDGFVFWSVETDVVWIRSATTCATNSTAATSRRARSPEQETAQRQAEAVHRAPPGHVATCDPSPTGSIGGGATGGG